jgi:hypothetical protein
MDQNVGRENATRVDKYRSDYDAALRRRQAEFANPPASN